MVVEEDVRRRLQRKLEDAFGKEEAALLMDRPPGGWEDLITVPVFTARSIEVDHRFDTLEHRFDTLEVRFDAFEHRFESFEHRFQGMEYRFEGMDAKLGSLKVDILGEMEHRFRSQTWAMISSMLAMMMFLTAVFAAISTAR